MEGTPINPSGNVMETVMFVAGTICFLVIAYKSYTVDSDVPTKEEILDAVGSGIERAVANNMSGETVVDVPGSEKADLN